MKTLLRMFAVLLVVGPVQARAQERPVTLRLAFFSPQRVFARSVEGQAALARLSALQNERTQEIEGQHKKLQTLEQAVASVLTDEARQQRTRELERFRLDVQRFIEDAQAELMGLQREAESAFLAKIGPLVADVAQEQMLDLVLNEDTGVIAWANPDLDITPQVVARLDAQAQSFQQ